MPKFTLDLSPAAVVRLQHVVNGYNLNNGTAITLTEWMHLHLKEVATQEEMAGAVDALRKQAEANATAALNDALTAERKRLLASLDAVDDRAAGEVV